MVADIGFPPSVMQPFVQAVLGLIVGSFLALVSVRLPSSEPIAASRSICRSCRRQLSPLELVPLLSWCMQRGRCRRCNAPISPRYGLFEFGCAGLGVWSAFWTPGWVGLAGAFMAWQLVLIAVVDAEHFWLPRVLTLPLVATGLATTAFIQPTLLPDHLLGVAGGFASLWMVMWIYRKLRRRNGLGGGDPYLLAGIGAWVGWLPLPMVVVCASGLGLLVVGFMWANGGVVTAQTRLPFGTLLAFGGWAMWLAGSHQGS